jgi:hypothetical protein
MYKQFRTYLRTERISNQSRQLPEQKMTVCLLGKEKSSWVRLAYHWSFQHQAVGPPVLLSKPWPPFLLSTAQDKEAIQQVMPSVIGCNKSLFSIYLLITVLYF